MGEEGIHNPKLGNALNVWFFSACLQHDIITFTLGSWYTCKTQLNLFLLPTSSFSLHSFQFLVSLPFGIWYIFISLFFLIPSPPFNPSSLPYLQTFVYILTFFSVVWGKALFAFFPSIFSNPFSLSPFSLQSLDPLLT